jgi:DNA gyrase subunit A
MSIDICKELSQNFIDFAYEANSQRAFPDARDGLKPGQRACLWEMYVKGYASNKPHVKSAKIDGGVAATWWPHGTTAIYETFARMSQDWINNIPEVDWHGSNGNIVISADPAADRYTEARLAKATEEGMLAGIKKNTVPMILNFTEDEEWPEVLPAIFPRLIINGSQGIGVAIAQVWVPHNLTEIANAIQEYIATGTIDYNKLAPDFPSGGVIINKNDLHTIYETGKGKVVLRGKATIDNNTIKITALPYQVYVEPFIDSIRKLIEDGEIDGIKEIYNKTDLKKGLLVEIECEKTPLAILNKLYQATDLQKSYSPNQTALVGKTPKLLNLKNYFDIYIEHNISCIKKEYQYDLEKAKAKLEITEGLLKALEDIDNIITLIKTSESAAKAKEKLIEKYSFTENQAKAILDMKLSRLAHLEYVELENTKKDLLATIDKCNILLLNETSQKEEFMNRLNTFVKKYGFERRTEVTQVTIPTSKEEKENVNVEPEKCVVVMTEGGTIKRIPAASFRTQKRNGVGVKTQEDITSMILRTNTIDSLMIFSNQGKMYRLLVNDIPVGTNVSKGQSIKSLVAMDAGEEPTIIYSIYRDTDAKFVLFVTKNGLVKKTSLDEYINTKKKTGIGAISLKDSDELAIVTLIKDEPLILVTKNGYTLKFNSNEIGATSRMTCGVKGITLADGDYVVSALPIRNGTDTLALFAENGYGKKIPLSELQLQKRGGKGLIGYKIQSDVCAATLVAPEDKILIVGDKSSICISANDIPLASRASQGNLMIKNGNIITVSKV